VNENYKSLFQTDVLAEKYEKNEYAPSSGSALYWEVEKGFLMHFISGLTSEKKSCYLDFACGTGRILQVTESLVESSEGIDISEAMLKIAASKVKKSKLICLDVSIDQSCEYNKRYDLITSFRFFPNVEHEVRLKALDWLAKVIKPDGIMIINTHLNPYSLKALFYPYHQFMSFFFKKPRPKYLSTRQMRGLLGEYGFRIEKVYGLGFLSGRLVPLLPRTFSLAFERFFAGGILANRFGFNLIYVCRKNQ